MMKDKRMDDVLTRKMELDFDEIEGRRSLARNPEAPAGRRLVAAALVLVGLGVTIGVAVLASQTDENGDEFDPPATRVVAQERQKKDAPQEETPEAARPRKDLAQKEAAVQRMKNEFLQAKIARLQAELSERQNEIRRLKGKGVAPESAPDPRGEEGKQVREIAVDAKRAAELEAARAAELHQRAKDLRRALTRVQMRGLPGAGPARRTLERTPAVAKALDTFDVTRRRLEQEIDVDRALELVDELTRQLGDVRRALWESKQAKKASRR